MLFVKRRFGLPVEASDYTAINRSQLVRFQSSVADQISGTDLRIRFPDKDRKTPPGWCATAFRSLPCCLRARALRRGLCGPLSGLQGLAQPRPRPQKATASCHKPTLDSPYVDFKSFPAFLRNPLPGKIFRCFSFRIPPCPGLRFSLSGLQFSRYRPHCRCWRRSSPQPRLQLSRRLRSTC
jgi:hypothetical protein